MSLNNPHTHGLESIPVQQFATLKNVNTIFYRCYL